MALNEPQNDLKATLSMDGRPSVDAPIAKPTISSVDGGEGYSAVQADDLHENAFSFTNDGSNDIERVENASSNDGFSSGTGELVHSVDTAAVNGWLGSNNAELRADDSGLPPEKRLWTRSRGDSITRQDSSSPLRKATPFKSVSVTKNFLAKSTQTPSRPVNDRAPISSGSSSSTMAQLTARPRLVAKSGKDARPLASLSRATSSTAPDASKVWNKNKPAAPPPSKQFTDEELKQQYGIHLTARLQADETGKESKWADIDDEEDDWAPETVTWMDGTKSTITQADELAQIGGQQNSDSAQPEATAVEEVKSDNEAQSRSTTLGAGKTILRPGARANGAQVKPGLVLRSLPESFEPPPKPATPGAAKSPWAQLPPVDKASPITFNPPQQEQFRSFANQQGPTDTAQAPFPPQSITREIAADDFDRSWKESDRGQRELFDSRSGRYEPVRAVRRSSMRQDQNFRPPAVLQRPGQQQAVPDGEPPSWSNAERNLSREWEQSTSAQASVSSDRRESADHSHATDEKGDLSTHVPDNMAMDPNNQAYAFRPQENQYGGPSPSGPSAEDRAVQQKIMKERIEANRRRKEEEARQEEAAKKERLRLKLEALGPAPSKTPQKPASISESMSAEGQAATAQQSSAETADTARAPHISGDADFNKNPETIQSISKADPQLSNIVQEASINTMPPAAAIDDASALSTDQDLPMNLKSPTPTPNPEKEPDMARINELRSGVAAPWLNPHHEENNLTPAHWVSPRINGNVWGPPTNDKSLGNGSFETSLQGLPPMHMHPQANSHRQPGFLGSYVTPPPQRASPHNSQSPALPSAPETEKFKSTWNMPEKFNNQEKERRAFEASQPPNQPMFKPVYHETFRQLKPTGNLGGRQIVSTTTKTIDTSEAVESRQPVPPPADHSFGAQFQGHGTIGSGAPGKASRFFGGGADRYMSAAAPMLPMTRDTSYDRSPSPPPPETFDHPVNNKTAPRPLVHLPAPAPTVKLPPPESPEPEQSSNDQSVIMPPRIPPLRNGAQPIVTQAAWQDRFNGLFGRKPVSPVLHSATMSQTMPPAAVTVRGGAAAPARIASSSIIPLEADVGVQQTAATVSLPQKIMANPILPSYAFALPDNQIHTKEDMADSLLDEREFGSSPAIKVPRVTYKLDALPAEKIRQQAMHRHGSESYWVWTTTRVASEPLLDGPTSPLGTLMRISIPGKPIKQVNHKSKTATAQGSSPVRPNTFDSKRRVSKGSPQTTPVKRGSGTPRSRPVDRPTNSPRGMASGWAKPTKAPPRSKPGVPSSQPPKNS